MSDARFEEMIVEAEELSGRSLVAKEWVGAGEDFPRCPYRPAARFALLDVGDAPEGGVARDKGRRTTIAEELGARDEGGSGGIWRRPVELVLSRVLQLWVRSK